MIPQPRIDVVEEPLMNRLLNGMHPKQEEFATSQERWIGMVGGPGKGATSAAIVRSLLLTLAAQDNPGPVANRGFFGMFEQKRLYQTTIQDFTALLAEMRIPYEINKMEALIWVPGLRLELYWGACDEPKKIVNANLGFAFIEQAECGTPWETFTKLDRRMRFPGVFHSVFFSANAYPKNHWITNDFIELGGKVVFSSPRDNAQNLPKDFLKSLDSMDPVTRKEYEDGELTTLGGLMYPMARRAEHGITGAEPWPTGDIVRAWDYGRQAATASQKQRNQMVLLAEWLGEPGEPLRNFKTRVCEDCREWWGNRNWTDLQDPSGRNKDVTRTTSAYEIMVSFPDPLAPIDAVNDIPLGHEIVRELMTKREEGLPLIVADRDRCPNIIEGWTYGYIAKPRTEGLVPHLAPVDNVYKHLQDCVRYTAVHLFGSLYEERPAGPARTSRKFPGMAIGIPDERDYAGRGDWTRA